MKYMRIAIAIKADKNVEEMYQLTFPSIKKYADKIGAKVIRLNKNKGLHYHYKILQLYKLLKKYDRILVLDCDILIKENCPDLFAIVPEDKIGSVFEDKGSRLKDRRNRIEKVQEKFGDIGWKEGYINTGVAMFSKCHRDLFKKRELWMNLGFDDVYLGYHLKKLGYEVYELPFQFNHMRMFSEPWNGNPDRFNSYIIHYAGFLNRASKQLKEIQNDLYFLALFPER